MKRFWLFSIVVLISVGLVVPAFAEHSMTGFYRAKGWVSNYQQFSAGNLTSSPIVDTLSQDPATNTYVEQRARFKFNFTNNEFVKTVLYLESDVVWGDSQLDRGGNRNSGGGIGADSVNIELKNLYTWFKIPDTDYEFQVGLQNFNDAYYGNFIGVQDAGGIIGKAKMESVNVRYGWLKFAEANLSANMLNNDSIAVSDDLDFYLLEVKFNPTEKSNVGLNGYFMNDDRNRSGAGTTLIGGTQGIGSGSTTDLFILGANGVLKLDAVTLSGFAAYQGGTVNANAAGVSDRDISAFAINLRGDLKVGPGDLFVEGMYMTGDDNSADNDIEGWQGAPGLNSSFYYRADTQILFYNGDDETTATALFADGNQGGNADGRGVIAIMAGYKFKPADAWSAKIGAGWAQDAEGDSAAAAGNLNGEEKSAFEINGHLNYLITKGLTAGVYGAYAALSDVPTSADPTVEADDIYLAYWRLQYAF